MKRLLLLTRILNPKPKTPPDSCIALQESADMPHAGFAVTHADCLQVRGRLVRPLEDFGTFAIALEVCWLRSLHRIFGLRPHLLRGVNSGSEPFDGRARCPTKIVHLLLKRSHCRSAAIS